MSRPREFGCPRRRAARIRQRLAGIRLPDIFDAGTPRHTGVEIAAAVVAVAAIAGAGIAAYGQYQQAQQQAAVLQYNAMVAQQQAAQQAEYQIALAGVQASMMERQAMGVTALAQSEAAMAQEMFLTQSKLTEAQIQAAQTAGAMRERQIQRGYERTQSEVRAAVGKAGIDTTGSPLMVLLENADTAGEELAINDYKTALDVAGAQADLALSGQSLQMGARSALTSAQLRAQSLRAEAGFTRFGAALGADFTRSQGASQAALFSSQVGGVRSAGMLNAGATLLGGFGAAASPYLRYGRASGGGFPGYGYGTA